MSHLPPATLLWKLGGFQTFLGQQPKMTRSNRSCWKQNFPEIHCVTILEVWLAARKCLVTTSAKQMLLFSAVVGSGNSYCNIIKYQTRSTEMAFYLFQDTCSLCTVYVYFVLRFTDHASHTYFIVMFVLPICFLYVSEGCPSKSRPPTGASIWLCI